ncbi:MAG: FtsX-like permease family protein [Tetrasphaera sp.]
MLTLALSNLRTQPRRYLAPALAIALGVAFVAAALTLGATLSRGVTAAISSDIPTYAAVASPSGRGGGLPPTALEAVTKADGVAQVRAVRTQPGLAGTGNVERFVVLSTPPSPGSKARLSAGRMPTADKEIAISLSAQAASGKHLGESWSISPLDGGRATTTAIVGIVDAGADAQYAGGTPVVFATSATVAAISGDNSYQALFVSGAPGSSPADVVRSVQAALGSAAEVRTGPAYADQLVADVTGGTDFISAILLGFAGISLFAAALVIGNTYAILASRRMRESALIRCIGVSRSVLLRANVIESAALGLCGSVAGVALGVGLAAVAAGLAGDSGAGLPLEGVAITPVAILIPLFLGVVVTVLACLRPAWRATRVPPVAALRPEAAVIAGSRAGRLRIALGFTVMALGVGLLAVVIAGASLPAGLAGGALSFLGVLLTSSVLVPALLAGIGKVAGRPFGAPGELAVENAVRNPARASATTSALLVGVTLISMLVVGGATTQRSAAGLINEEYPIDIALAAPKEIPRGTVAAATAVDGIAASAPLAGADLRIAGDTDPVRAVGITDAARQVTRYAEGLRPVGPDSLVVAASFAASRGLKAGQPVTVSAGSGPARELRVVLAATNGHEALIDAQTLAALAPAAPVTSLWLRMRGGADAGAVTDGVQAAVRDLPGLDLSSGANGRERIQSMLDTMVLVAAALLAVAVLIALVGIGNTLSLSVIERTRENGLLRALGLTARQLRATLAIEAVLIAVVGALLGVALGAAYGICGAYALLGADVEVRPDLPVSRLLLIMAVALVAGLLASVLPARQAGRVPPSVAIAAE